MNKTIGSSYGIPFWRRPHLSRRVFFRHIASAIGGYYLMPSRPMETVAKAQPTLLNKAKYCIFIFMDGGPSHVDTFDLKEGPWTPAALNPTDYGDIRFPQGLFPNIAEQLDSICLLRSFKSWTAVHELGQVWAQIGRNPTSVTAKIAPHIGSVVSLELGDSNSTLPKFMSMNGGRVPTNGYFPAEHGPFFFNPNGNPLPNTSHRDGQTRLEKRFSMLMEMDSDLRRSGVLGAATEEIEVFTEQAKRLVYNDDVDRVFRLDPADMDRYAGVDVDPQRAARNGFANACVTARNLLKSNLGTKFIHINTGGWDNHERIYTGGLNANDLKATGRRFDFGLGNLIKDLKELGLLDDTLIIAMGEFGRTCPGLNNRDGRDHYQQQSVLLAGAKIQGPKAIGTTTPDGKNTLDPGWSRGNREQPAGPSIRTEDLEATIYSALGIDYTTILRNDPLGRGFEYVPESARDIYGPVDEIWDS